MISPLNTRQSGSWTVALVSCALAAVHAFLVYALYFPGKTPPSWDPAAHQFQGLLIYSDLVTGNFVSFLVDTYRQVYWPFLHSWAVAAAAAVTGPTDEAARLVSLVCYEASAVVIALLAVRARPATRGGWVAALALWFTASQFIAAQATEALLESAAIFMTLASLLVLDRAFVRGTERAYAVAGLLQMLTYFAKTEFGILIMASTAIVLLRRLLQRTSEWRQAAAFVLPIAIVSILWFAYPPKVLATIEALVNQRVGPDRFSREGLLFNFQQLHNWSDTTVSFLCFGVAVVAAGFIRDARPVVHVILIYIGLGLALHVLSFSKDAKHTAKFLSMLVLMFAFAWDGGWLWLGRRRSAVLWRGAALVTLGALIAHRATLFPDGLARQPNSVEPILRTLVQRVATDQPIVILGEFAELSPLLVNNWLLARDPRVELREWGNPAREQMVRVMSAMPTNSGWFRIIEPGRRVQTVAHSPTLPWAGRTGPSNAEIVDQMFRELHPSSVTVLTVAQSSPYFTADYVRTARRGDDYAAILTSRPDLRLAETVSFDAVGVALLRFERRQDAQ